jgi:hypothetical protein
MWPLPGPARLIVSVAFAQLLDPARYPEFAGQGIRNVGAQSDPIKPCGIGQ